MLYRKRSDTRVDDDDDDDKMTQGLTAATIVSITGEGEFAPDGRLAK
jgi:hypothetical protein